VRFHILDAKFKKLRRNGMQNELSTSVRKLGPAPKGRHLQSSPIESNEFVSGLSNHWRSRTLSINGEAEAFGWSGSS
jgi:hypothetical protein